MGLQVWLPLNGNIDNQGTYDITTVNVNATVDANGKIGNCYYFNGTTSRVYADNVSLSNTAMSAASWVQWESLTNCDYPVIFCLGSNVISTGYQIGMFLYKTTHKLTIGSSGKEKQTTFIPETNTWYHICCTYSGNEAKLYVNGELISTLTNGTSHKTQTHLCIGARPDSTSGAGTAFKYPMQGKINDFRLYDHCLSSEEVKHLAQGLTVHYSLSNRGFGQDNLVPNSQTEKSCVNGAARYVIPAETATQISGQRVTVSADIKSTVNNVRGDIYFGGVSSGVIGSTHKFPYVTTEYKRYSVTFTAPSLSAACAIVFRNNASAGGNTTATYSYRNIKVEFGDKATPWIPNSSDELYSEFALNTTKEYDLSGYQHDGIKNNLTNDSDSPVNQGCYVFNGTNSWLKCNTNDWMIQGCEEFTMNFWAYSQDWTTMYTMMASCTQSGGFNITSGDTGYMRFQQHIYTNSAKTSAAYRGNTSGIQLESLSSGWHMFTFIYTLEGERIYTDGTLCSSSTTASYGFHWNRSARLFLGCEANTANPTSPYFNGKMADFRLYMTALSANDVLELYRLGEVIQ